MDNPSGVRSKINIKGHPVHPMLVTFPIASFAGALTCDSMYAATKDKFWSRASYYLVATGLGSGLAAAAVGLTDFASIRRARVFPDGWVHMFGNAAALGLATASLTMRVMNRDSAVVPKGLALQSAIASLLAATTWYGGELTFRRRIGVSPVQMQALEEMRQMGREAA